jgi:NAD(P)-dependent dehydrogenase (short-subunit alcohol dehydrogenase family)|tara:strand:- start:6238 stop:6489 length:252 start_codon:yes stop_codon:yes gene_type:complete
MIAMIDRGQGSIVNVCSVAGLSTGAESAAYMTSKHVVVGLTKSMAMDYGKNNIRINTLCPGWVRIPMSEDEMTTLAQDKNASL